MYRCLPCLLLCLEETGDGNGKTTENLKENEVTEKQHPSLIEL